MSISLDAELIGAKELSKKLEALGAALSGKLLRQAAGTAMTPVVKQARQNAPRGTRAHKTYTGRLVAPGFLSRNIKKKTFKSKSGLYASASVSAASEAFYGPQFLERGTKHIAKNPWLTKSFDNKKTEVTNKFKIDLQKKILRAAKKR